MIGHPAAALVLGHALRANGDQAGAVAIWRRIGALPYFLQRARSLSSLDDASIAVELDPANAQAHEARGRLLEDQRRVAEAVASYRQARAVVRPGEEALALLLKGHELRLLGDAGVVDAYQRAVDAAPGVPAPLYFLADAAAKAHDFPRAESAYLRVLQLLPDDFFARLALAEVWMTAGDTARAVEAFEAIAAAVPASGRAPAFLGHIALQRGDLLEARRRLDEAVSREPQLAWAHEWLGDARRAQGDNAGAIQAYREAVRLDPSQAGAAEQLRRLNITGRSPQEPPLQAVLERSRSGVVSVAQPRV